MNNLLKISNLKHRFLRKKKIFKGVIGTILIYFYMNKCIIRFTVNVATLYNTSWSARRCQFEKKLYFEEKKCRNLFCLWYSRTEYSRVLWKNFSPFGAAVWPLIVDIEKHIYKYDIRALLYRYIFVYCWEYLACMIAWTKIRWKTD